MPEKLDLECLRGLGLLPTEEPQPQPSQAQQPAPAPKILPDPQIVDALIDMGFSENGSKRAAVATKVALTFSKSRETLHVEICVG